jgi:steroid 5-alpha reductase family enzyme
MSFLGLLVVVLVAGTALSLIMTGAWKMQEATHNTGWIDVFWTFGMGSVAVMASLVPLASDPASPLRKIMVASLVALWSLRLGRHILMRTMSAGDDPRYRNWIVQWGTDARRRMFWHLQSQASVGLLFALAVILAAHNARPQLHAQDAIGLAILIAAIIGESIADRQLRHFKADPVSRGRICDIGLWAWSRHPNYFFEWVCWLAYPVIAIDLSGYNPYGWLALAAPACMYWILIYVSGIPPLEEHMLMTHGDQFRDYQRRTSAFIPLPPSRAS